MELQSFILNEKKIKLEIKIALFGFFWAKIWRNYYHIWNQHLQICGIAKFHSKRKSLNLRPRIPYLGIFRLKFVETIMTFEISTFEFVKMQSFMLKKISLGPNCLILVFWLKFEKTIVIFEISIPGFIKNQFLIIIVNFIIGPTFSKGPGSTFSESPGSGPLYKVCLSH